MLNFKPVPSAFLAWGLDYLFFSCCVRMVSLTWLVSFPSQMTQQMAGMNFYGANGMMGYGQSMGGGSAQGTNQTLSSQMWK